MSATTPADTDILLIDDDVRLCKLLTQYLSSEGYAVEAVHRGEEGAARAVGGTFGLVVLDVMLPRMDGFEVLRQIRAVSDLPVVMLTARGEEMNRIVGLELGADDYLAKPFSPRELVARIRAVLRRTSGVNAAEVTRDRIAIGDIEMDLGARRVRRAGERVHLTGVEFNLLAALVRSAGSVLSRERLSREVLGRRLLVHDRSLDMHVSNLRKKLGHQIGGDERIRSIRGVGYVYAATDDVAVRTGSEPAA
ncbi:MAG: response regulator transcription factor [Phycisphaerales bacterium]|nr:response regulator transcription factor [Phycisphaerales bacterium]